MAFTVFPGNTNHYDTLFGGTAMAWMDQAAFICATRWCRRKVVTVHIGEIDFRHAVPEGSIVELVARVVKTGRSSMTIRVEMFVEPMDREDRLLATSGEFVMVALDSLGQPAAVTPLEAPGINAPDSSREAGANQT
ncbi:acyl-CoA thioesterase [Rhodocaloribacter litoris]|uniref:acyl-CoA thioesterase n=1 Tax=Rhodocaloribacter litoris TaxID=2558931 RepID=UPI0014210B9A|nr:acyl-CoA thioesterase [Rhodocaloribacter litoris]